MSTGKHLHPKIKKVQPTIPTVSFFIFKPLLLLVLVYRSLPYLQTLVNSQIVLTNEKPLQSQQFLCSGMSYEKDPIMLFWHAHSTISVNIAKMQTVSRRVLPWFFFSRNKCLCKKKNIHLTFNGFLLSCFF